MQTIAHDTHLVAAVREGSTRAFEQIVARYEAPLTAYARKILGGSHHDAEEAVQDAFVKALGAMRRDLAREITLKPWLYAITRNACLDRLRRPTRTVDIVPLEAVLHDRAGDPTAAVERRERLQLLVGGLNELPVRQRDALVMHELEGRSHQELARRLGVSVGASKALVCRARQGVAHLRDAA
ncbi:MAG TPA: sigma-70 family RNA polymerase sigma factor [Solirubrobacteraceae bacterium]